MFHNRIVCLLAALCCLAGLAVNAAAAEVASDSVYCFSPEDFSETEGLLGICITDLPEAAAGTAMLGSRVLQEGDVLTAEQVAQMTFTPVGTEFDRTAQVGYLPIYADYVAQKHKMQETE